MNYVILNGIKSTTVKGLLIQSLPSISKPLIRTTVEEIDGRDGDIVTKLGYSAYDKAMSIGLYGDFDIDDVIQYFDSAGTVTFSNEPDKYYRYEIINQIDFERLIRFRTATVTFHVQPFKYSAVEDVYTFNNNYVEAQNFSSTKNGVTVAVQNGKISVSGTATSATEFYVPLKSVTVPAGDYQLVAVANGNTADVCSIRVIKTAPSNAESFGGNYLPLVNGGTATMSGNVSENTTYGYLWFYFNPNGAMSFTLDVSLLNIAINSVSIRNNGNIFSRPIIGLSGNGTVNLSVNGIQLFVVDLDGEIEIDAEGMNAYKDNVLANRSVTGNYDNLTLKVGANTISWSGNVDGITVQNYTRWL